MDVIKVKLASIHFEGKALHWFKAFLSTKEKDKLILCDKFMESLTARFGKQVSELKKLRQEGSL